jgi:bla regulator protein BlaR1
MQTILYNISQVIGVTIIHSLWQGLLIYLLLRLALLFFTHLSSKAKHNLAIAALLAITVWFVYTLLIEISVYNWVALKTNDQGILSAILAMPIHVRRSAPFSLRYYYTIEGLLPYITILYIAGLVFNTMKLIWARKKINAIRQTMSIEIELLQQVAQFANMLNISKKVKIGVSKLVDVPCMMGYFKPVILLPFTLSTNLSTEEIGAIILHELAHIKRNDYLINLAQQTMSVLLFFNPFAQLINRTINKERENSCDDLVIEATQKPLVYAHALLKLEQTRQHEWQLALAATGKKYHLLNRIERIMKTKKPIGNARHILLAIVLLTASITGLAWLNPAIANGKISINKIKPIIADLFGDTTTHKKTTKTQKVATTKKPAKKHSTTIYKNGKSYTYNDSESFNDAQLEKLSAEVSKYGEEVSKYYESPAFKKYQEEMELKGKAIQDFYDKPELKELQEKMEKISADFQKNWGDNTETEKLSRQMEADGKKIEQYYNSEEFKKFNEPLEKKYGIEHNGYQDRDNENYRKYHEEVEQHVPAEIKQLTQDLRKMGTQMRDRFHSPEYEKQREAMKTMGDSMRRAFRNPAIQEQQAEMRKLGEQMRAMQNNPEIKKVKEQMREAQAKMRAYMNTPEFKKRMNEWRKYSYHYDWNWDEKRNENRDENRNENKNSPEKPEKPDTTGNN